MYCVEIDQGDYLQVRGGYDWGRANTPSDATLFDSPAQARSVARQLGVRVVAVIDYGWWVQGRTVYA
jgi:hypothetical protein